MVSMARSLTRFREMLKQKKAQIYSRNCKDFVGPYPEYDEQVKKLPDSLANAVAVDSKLEQIDTW